jgi:hypothetical protein
MAKAARIHRKGVSVTTLCGAKSKRFRALLTENNDAVTCGRCRYSMWKSWGIAPDDEARLPKLSKSGINWEKEKRLGTMPDEALGKLLGVSGAAVHYARKRLGIPSWRDQQDGWDSQPLGKMPDALLALMLDCPVGRVASARTSRGIPPFRQRSKWIND